MSVADRYLKALCQRIGAKIDFFLYFPAPGNGNVYILTKYNKVYSK